MNIEKAAKIIVDNNPINSKAFEGMLFQRDAMDIVLQIQNEEILPHLNINQADLPFYVFALESLAESLATAMNSTGKILLDDFRKHSKIITTHIDMTKKHDNDNSEENKDEE